MRWPILVIATSLGSLSSAQSLPLPVLWSTAIPGPEKAILSNNGSNALVSEHNRVVLQKSNGKSEWTKSFEGSNGAALFSPDGSKAYLTGFNLREVDVETGVEKILLHGLSTIGAGISPGGTSLVLADPYSFLIYNPTTRTVLRRFVHSEGYRPQTIQVTSGGLIVSNGPSVYSTAGKKLWTKGGSSLPFDVSKDGKTVFQMASFGRLIAYDAQTGAQKWISTAPQDGPADSFAATDDGLSVLFTQYDPNSAYYLVRALDASTGALRSGSFMTDRPVVQDARNGYVLLSDVADERDFFYRPVLRTRINSTTLVASASTLYPVIPDVPDAIQPTVISGTPAIASFDVGNLDLVFRSVADGALLKRAPLTIPYTRAWAVSPDGQYYAYAGTRADGKEGVHINRISDGVQVASRIGDYVEAVTLQWKGNRLARYDLQNVQIFNFDPVGKTLTALKQFKLSGAGIWNDIPGLTGNGSHLIARLSPSTVYKTYDPTSGSSKGTFQLPANFYWVRGSTYALDRVGVVVTGGDPQVTRVLLYSVTSTGVVTPEEEHGPFYAESGDFAFFPDGRHILFRDYLGDEYRTVLYDLANESPVDTFGPIPNLSMLGFFPDGQTAIPYATEYPFGYTVYRFF
ncbi:hypothetical protein EON81_07580 [bacterium]|nr:MAG: hypothetical protein EON81_07580 [bacterium]